MSQDEDLISELESHNDEFHLCRAFYIKKRSGRYKRGKRETLLELDDGKYLLPDFPCDPQGVTLRGVRLPITCFVIHGREVIWTGKCQERPPRKVWASYECWEEHRIHSKLPHREDGSDKTAHNRKTLRSEES